MKSAIDFFMGRPVTASMLFLALCLFGAASLGFLPLGLMPPTQSPAITITTKYPGISPGKIEEILTKPIEEQALAVGGIDEIFSVSEEGESRINITFAPGSEVAKKSLEVRARINLIRDGFPREVEEPVIMRYDPTDRPVWIARMESDSRTLKDLRDIAENKLKQRLERVEGVSEIKVGGGALRQINVDVDRGLMENAGIPIGQLMQALDQANVELPTGSIEVGPQNDRVGVRVLGRFKAVDSIGDIVVGQSESGALIRIKDIAFVRDATRDREDISRENGREIVSIYVHQAGDANTIAVCDGLEEELAAFQMDDVELRSTYNQADSIRKSVSRVRDSAILGGIVASLVLFAFLRNLRATFTIAVAIPSSILITFGVMYGAGLGLHLMTLSGLALGAGMLIDNSIVVLENVFQLRDERGHDAKIAGAAAHRIAGAVFASTLTNIAVFFPIFFGSFELRQLYGGLATVVSSSLAVSLGVSLLFLPVLAAALFRKDRDYGEDRLGERFPRLAARISPVLRAIQGRTLATFHFLAGLLMIVLRALPRFARTPLEKLQTRFNRRLVLLRRRALRRYAENPHEGRSFAFAVTFYEKLLRRTLQRRRRILAFACVSLFSAAMLGPCLKQEYIDPMDTGEIRANVELETGTHLDATNDIVKKIEELLRQTEGVESVQSKVEKWHADIYVRLEDRNRRNRSTTEMIEVLQKRVEPVGQAFVYFVESGAGAGGRELDVEFMGDDMQTLQDIAREAASMTRRIPGVQETVLRFRGGKDELALVYDRQKGALAGVTAQNFAQTLKTSLQGSIPTKFLDEKREEIDIKVRFQGYDRDQLNQVLLYRIAGQESSVAVAELSRQREGPSETKIYRKNKRKTAAISIKLGDLDMGTAVERVRQTLKDLQLPPDYYYEFGGEYEKLQRNQREMLLMIALALILVYGALASLFESYVYPAVIFTTIPLAACGVIWTLYLFDMSLNISVYIGAIMLAGIVVNNSIILVDRILQRFREEPHADRARSNEILIAVGRERLRPILMTTCTTLLAMTPMLFDSGEGSQMWRPLAATVVSGLAFSTALTLLVTPAVFSVLRDFLDMGRRLRARAKANG